MRTLLDRIICESERDERMKKSELARMRREKNMNEKKYRDYLENLTKAQLIELLLQKKFDWEVENE